MLHTFITKTRLFKNIEFFTKKNWKFSDKNFDIEWGYMVEPLHWGGSYEYPQTMFLSRIRKKIIPPQTPVLLYKSGV